MQAHLHAKYLWESEGMPPWKFIITYCEIEVRGNKACRGFEGMPLKKFQNFEANNYFNIKSTSIKMHVPVE